VSADAIAAAQRSAAGLLAQRPDCGPIDFVVGDATAYAIAHPAPDLVVVNPPRRGLDDALATWLDESTVRTSSTPVATSLPWRATWRMPSLIPHQARLFDMFPQTDHHEVMVRLRRSPNAHA
jgi:23S rRNA (uracil747-C5)-methyltransferase